jgi:rare lipoprotein A
MIVRIAVVGGVMACAFLAAPVMAQNGIQNGVQNGTPGAVQADPAARAEARRLAAEPPVGPPPGHQLRIDHSGRRQQGKVSFYAHKFDGRKMADGQKFDPNAHVAASKALPLGTQAKVTNLATGKSTEVTVEDHGPFVDGRVMDVSPRVAHEIGLDSHTGVAPAIVAPVTVPQPDGQVKLGAGAAPP